MARFLFGPVTPEFADQCLHDSRRQGDCLTFGPEAGSDLEIGSGDTWEDLCRRLPDGWRPDLIFLYLSYTRTPPCFWSASVPLIGLALDWSWQWHSYRRLLPFCDLVLTDSAGVEVCDKAGIAHARFANLFGCERRFLDPVAPAPERDIDVLFVGSLHSAVQQQRLPWVGRLARLASHRRVLIHTGVLGDDYRSLLARARIVFNYSAHGECNRRTFEVTAAGALLFQEAGNREVPLYFQDCRECVYYRADDLEELLDYYLDHEDERRALAEAAHAKAADCSFERLWDGVVQQVLIEGDQWRDRAAQRLGRNTTLDLAGRTWQALNCPRGGVAELTGELTAALVERPNDPGLHHALGLAFGLEATEPAPAAAKAAHAFARALAIAPNHVLAGLNRVEALHAAGNKAEAAALARQTLQTLEWGPQPALAVLDAGHFGTGISHFRAGWEQAAWANAGDPAAELHDKLRLLRWQLHALLAELTGQLAHFYEAVRFQPTLPAAQAALGHALVQASQPAEALPYLRQALTGNPFDLLVAHTLYQALGAANAWPDRHRLAHARQLLHRAAPEIVPTEAWFPDGPAISASTTLSEDPVRVVWEGGFQALYSLDLVNRALCERLLKRGQEVALLSTNGHRPLDGAEPLPADLAGRCGQDLSGPTDVHVRHEWPPRWTPPPSGRWVVMQHWEFGSLPRAWVQPLAEAVDEVWVLTAYARRCFVESGVPANRVQVVPGGVDVELMARPQLPFPLRTEKRFRFLFVGGTIARKGIDLLLAAYARAFRRQDDVCLVIKDLGTNSFYKGQTAEKLVARHQADPEAPAVEYLDRGLGMAELASLYQSCHCLVHPYRGEGFGMPITEAMACSLPVIVTGYGAALDFCNEDNAFLLPARERRLPKKQVGDLETVGHPWLAEPDVDLLCHYLRYVVEYPEEAQCKGRAAAAHIVAHFSWDRAADRVLERLRYLRSQPVRRDQRLPIPAVRPAVAPENSRARVSLCMIVKNEEANLPTCLDSIADLVSEMIVVDTGSTDHSRAVAAQHGARVYDFAWVDNFAAARNESLRHATGDWVFWLDADEFLDGGNRARLRALFDGLGRENVAYLMRQHSGLEVAGQAAVVDQVRLFPRHPALRWRYRVHEQILPSLREQGTQLQSSDVVICHTGFIQPALQGPKVDRNLRLLLLDHQDDPDNSFTLYNLGAVALTQGRLTEALDWLRRSLARSGPRDTVLRKLYALLARCHHQLGQPQEALAVCQAGYVALPDNAELLFWEAMVRRGQKDYKGAERCLVRLLQIPVGVCFTSADAGLRGHRAHQLLAEVLQLQGRAAEAEKHWQAALKGCPDLPVARLELARWYAEQERWADLDNALPELGRYPNLAAEASLLRGQGLLARKDYAGARAAFQEVISARPKEVRPRLLLSRAYLQEGQEGPVAEQALRDVLALDPTNREAQHNLAVLVRQRVHPEKPGTVAMVPAQAAARQRVSLAMIVRNEEVNLSVLLPQVVDLFDELILVDTGSTDRTKEIAARFQAKVFDFPWVDHFAAARNESLQHTTGDWVFWLDGDDRLDADNQQKLRQLLVGLQDEGAAYVMKCLCLPDPIHRAPTEVDHVRLFRNHSSLRWRYRVHEQIIPAIRALKHEVRWSDVVIQHTGYQDLALRQRKLQRDFRLLQLEFKEQPNDPFTLFNLGSAFREQGRYREALSLFRHSLARSAPTDSIVRKLYVLCAQCSQQLGQPKEALATCREGRNHYPDDLELLFQEGTLLREFGDLAGAALCWEKCLETPQGKHFASVNPGLRGHVTRHQLAGAYRDLGRLTDADAQWRTALAQQPDYEPAWRGLTDLVLAQERWQEAKSLVRAAEVGPPGPVLAAGLRGRMHLVRKNYAEARKRLVMDIERWPRTVELRILFSQVLFQEGKDWDATERALCDVLGVDPGNEEARQQLTLVLRKRGLGNNGVIPAELTLAELYRTACQTRSAANEHLPILFWLARSCSSVTHLGMRTPEAMTALLFAQPKMLHGYAGRQRPEIERLVALAGLTRFVFHEAGGLAVEIEETDLLFIDTWHVYSQLQEELRLHGGKVKKYLVLHATTMFGDQGETEGNRGLWPAVEEFLAQGTFKLKERYENNNGLTVLERVESLSFPKK